MIMKDCHQKSFPRIPREHQEGPVVTFISFACAILCISLMSWSCVDRYAQQPVAPYIDKEVMRENLKAQVKKMEADTIKFNEKMERIVAEGNKK
jgi:hypothetical protein